MQTTVRVVNLSGNVTLNGLPGVVQQLASAIEEKPSVVVSFTQTHDLDLAAIQVILAARKEAISRGGELRLSGTIEPPVSDRLLASGFISRPVSDGKELESQLFGGVNESV